MLHQIDRTRLQLILVVMLTTVCASPASSMGMREAQAGMGSSSILWKSPARWHHGLKKTSGTLALSDAGVEFKSKDGIALHWAYVEIQIFTLGPRQLILTGYENRKWRLYGDRNFRFDLETKMPPAVAAALSQRVGKPVENGVPEPGADAFADLSARHHTRGGGTNGVLRFRAGGIDYVTSDGRDARSWRWSDIQTIALPDAFHFRIGAYRENFEFELKQPMSRQLFERLWNGVYARDLRGLSVNGGAR